MFSIRRYITYFKYVFMHKYFVFRAAFYVDPYLPLFWRCLVHDMSKFKPSEFIPYAHTFVKDDGSKQYVESPAFDKAWNAHQKRNPHHWQYWMLKNDSGKQENIPMDGIYIKEMLCDWLGAGRAINGKWDFDFNWYKNNKHKICVADETRVKIEMWIQFIQTNKMIRDIKK